MVNDRILPVGVTRCNAAQSAWALSRARKIGVPSCNPVAIIHRNQLLWSRIKEEGMPRKLKTFKLGQILALPDHANSLTLLKLTLFRIISDLWMTYHEGKEKVHGIVLNGAKGKTILSRAAQCPFFLHPVFREEGHFMIVSQFQAPNYFLLAFLEDYRMDPARAQPLLTISVFDDFVDSKDLALVRCDIIAQGIDEDEGYKICKLLISDYSEDEDFQNVHMFNKKPDAFDVDEFVKEKERRWKENDTGGSIDTTSENN